MLHVTAEDCRWLHSLALVRRVDGMSLFTAVVRKRPLLLRRRLEYV